MVNDMMIPLLCYFKVILAHGQDMLQHEMKITNTVIVIMIIIIIINQLFVFLCADLAYVSRNSRKSIVLYIIQTNIKYCTLHYTDNYKE
jgi:nitrate/nitrite transporter NarK